MIDRTLPSPGFDPGADTGSAESSFWQQVRSETRATWHGRHRRLWIAGAILVEALIIGLYGPPLGGMRALQGAVIGTLRPGPLFYVLLTLCIYWLPLLVWTGTAALGADLLSLQYPENPEPHRQWPPRRFVARAAGRWIPWFFWSAVWLSTWMLLEFWAAHPGRIPVSALLPVSVIETRREAAVLLARVGLVTLPFAAVAALLSASSRRPRRGRLTLATWIVILVMVPVTEALAFQLTSPHSRSGIPYDQLLWVAEIAGAVGTVWWIARERYRWHPYTAAPRANNQPFGMPREEPLVPPSS